MPKPKIRRPDELGTGSRGWRPEADITTITKCIKNAPLAGSGKGGFKGG